MEEKAIPGIAPPDGRSALVLEAQSGNAEAFAELVEDCERTLYRMARTVLGNDQDCADAVQEAITKAWLKLGSLRDPAFFRTWLIRILLNECYKLSKRRKRPAPQTAAESVLGPGCLHDDLIDLRAALVALPEDQRVVVALHHVEEIPVAEIARLLRVPAGTVKSRLARARARLAESMRIKEERP